MGTVTRSLPYLLFLLILGGFSTASTTRAASSRLLSVPSEENLRRQSLPPAMRQSLALSGWCAVRGQRVGDTVTISLTILYYDAVSPTQFLPTILFL